MAVMTTGSFPKGLVPGVKKWFGQAYKDWDEEYTKVFDRVSSDRNYEEYVGVSGFGLAQVKPEGQSVTYDMARQGFVTRITNMTLALGFMVTEEEIEDNKWGPAAFRRARDLARSLRITKETLAGLVLSRAFDANYPGGDGKELCATDHPNVSGGTFSNELSTPADLSELALEQACINIMQWTDDRGLNIKVMPVRLIVHPNDVFEAERILKSTLQADTANNAINALRSRGVFRDGYAVNRYFDAGNGAWFIKTDCPDGMIYQERRAIRFEQDNDFDTSNAKFKASERYAFGWADPRGIFGSAGAA